MFLYPTYSHMHFNEAPTWAQSPHSEDTKVTFSSDIFTTAGNGRASIGKNPMEGVHTSVGLLMENHMTMSPTTYIPGGNFQPMLVTCSEQKPADLERYSGGSSTMSDFNFTEKCRTCGEEMLSGEIIQHMRNHMGPRRCEVCSYEAPTKHHLREHLNTHTGLKPYKCQFCDKCFAAKNSLRVHTMYLHTKVRAHQCHFCDQRFVTTSERKSHELVHTDKCPVCQMSFRLRGHLRQHMKSHANAAFHHKKR